MQNGNGTMRDRAHIGVEALGQIVLEHDDLLVQYDRVQTDNAMLKQRCMQLESRLATAETKAEHYQLYATELVAQLNSVQLLINSVVAKAEHATYTPPLVIVPKLPEVDGIDSGTIERLINRLPKNGGEPS